MASEVDIARLRRMTDTVGNTDPYTDELLGELIDTLGFDRAGASIWREKAATYASLVDTTESGSSRSLSQLQKQALAMAEMLEGGDEEEEVTTSGGSYTVEIERV